MKLKLRTSKEIFRELHVQCDASRTRPIRVERKALLDLLMDHSALAAELGPNRIEDPPDLLD